MLLFSVFGAVLEIRWKITRVDSVVVENAEINNNKNHRLMEINFTASTFIFAKKFQLYLISMRSHLRRKKLKRISLSVTVTANIKNDE